MKFDKTETIDKWYSRLRRAQTGHYTAFNFYQKFNLLLGIPTVILTAVVGTSIFASLKQVPNNFVIIIVGILSIISTVLSVLHTFLKFSEKAESHRNAAVMYGSIKRELEQRALFVKEDNEATSILMNEIRNRWDKANEKSPGIPKRILNAISWEIKSK